MEGMVVNAIFSLQDLLSGGLARIQGMLKKTDGMIGSLGANMGALARAMAPLAMLFAALALGLGFATGKAMAFESAMADVGKVVNFETQADFDAMGESILGMSTRIPMAAEGIAAIIASAAQSGVAKQDLAEFAEQAAKMGVAFDLTGDLAGKMMADWRAGMNLALPQVYALADAVNHLSNNMNATAPALGEVIQRVGPLAVTCGLAETQVAALGAAFLSAGASPEIAATALKRFTSTLVKGEAMSKRARGAFGDLGLSVTQMAKDMQTDAQGTIFKVLEAIANKPKELQVSLLTEMFGEESIGAIAPLLANMGNLSQAFNLVGNAANFAGSMQDEFNTRSKTTENSLQLLSNRFYALAVIIGNVFLPYVSEAANWLGEVVDSIRNLFATPGGQWFLRMAGAVASVVVGITLFAGAIWAVGAAMPFLSAGIGALKGALLGLGAPVWLLMGLGYGLYLAYKNNFGGMADTVNRWYDTISLVCQGVVAVFKTLSGGSGEIRGELAEKIEAAGLVGLVTNASKLAARFRWFFKAAFMQVQEHLFAFRQRFGAVLDKFGNAFARIGERISRVLAMLFGGEVTSGTDTWFRLGSLLGTVVCGALDAVAWALEQLLIPLEIGINTFDLLCALFTGDLAGAATALRSMVENIGQALINLASCLGFGEEMKAVWNDVMAFLDSINLFECGAKILGTLVDGIKSAKDGLVNSVSDAFSSVREYLPFSDAKRGPFSDLTASGAAILGTLGQGITGAEGGFISRIAGAFDQASAFARMGLEEAGSLLFPGLEPAYAPALATGQAAPPPATVPGRQAAGGQGGRTITISNLTVTLPSVTNGQTFMDELKNFLEQYDADDQ
ncbi:phage tail tape measure protein [Desulfovibrio cuneatus]|uniref:phage tail tape measure protein n=1 Tax=Desulfovibrio cuneatus TaxID=159728 RepID=UPI0003FF325D|nr:phage tail tape measure protein [Desulfovibrio cuneatus]